MRELVDHLWKTGYSLDETRAFGGRGVKEDGESREVGQSVLPVNVPMIHLILVEGRSWSGREKGVSGEFLTVYKQANALWYFSVDKVSSPF